METRGGSKQVAIVQLARFGDIIQSSPLIQNLIDSGLTSRDGGITLFVDRRTVAAAQLLYGVDEIIGVDLEEAAEISVRHNLHSYQYLASWVKSWLPAKRYDLVILLNQGDLTVAVASLINSEERRGPFFVTPSPPPHRYLTESIQNHRPRALHLCEVWAAYGPPIFPLRPPRIRTDISGTGLALDWFRHPLNNQKASVFAINLGAGGKERIIDSAKLAGLINALNRNRESRIVLLGRADEKHLAEDVLAEVDASIREKVTNLTGRTELADLPSILASTSVLISSDTGTLQLAAATGTRSLGFFFSGANPVETGPYLEGSLAVFADHNSLDDPDQWGREFASLAMNLEDQELPGRKMNDDQNFDLLVAGTSSVGIEYSPVGTPPWQLENLQRQRFEARQLIWSGDWLSGATLFTAKPGDGPIGGLKVPEIHSIPLEN